MSGEYPTPRRPPRETEANRGSGRRPPETPDDLDEAGGTEPAGPGAGPLNDWSNFLSPAAPGQVPAAPSHDAGGSDETAASDGGQDETGDPDGHGFRPPQSGVISPYGGDAPRGGWSPSYGEEHRTVTNANAVGIGLWGSPASGKTTYLAALPQALSNPDGSVGRWAIYPNNDVSTELLINWSHQLINKQMFPEATAFGDVTELSWNFAGDLTGSRYMQRGKFRRRLPAQCEFDLDLIDVSGEAFGHNPAERQVPLHVVDKALDHLARAEGLIFLFDPITERDKRTGAEYVNRTLTRLSRRVKEEGRLVGPYLPHYIAVCITKFDHKDVFRQARAAGLVNYGPDGMPRVLDEHAEPLFDAICAGTFWDGQRTDLHGGAQFVRNQLRRFFHPDRIRYYAISSIGYRKPPGWDPRAAARPGFRFDPKDFSNVIEQGNKQKILGPIEPINVLEPLVDLQMQITGRA